MVVGFRTNHPKGMLKLVKGFNVLRFKIKLKLEFLVLNAVYVNLWARTLRKANQRQKLNFGDFIFELLFRVFVCKGVPYQSL